MCIHGIIQVMSSSTANLDALEANADNNKRPKKRRRKLATVDERIKRDLGSMMYGFGDIPKPSPESIEVLFDLVQEFVSTITAKGIESETLAIKNGMHGTTKGYQGIKLTHAPLVQSIRRDQRLHERIISLLAAHKTIKATNKLIKDEELNVRSEDEE